MRWRQARRKGGEPSRFASRGWRGVLPRARLARVLTQREKPNPEEWRLNRVVQALELAGTAEAVALLKAWAAVDGSPVTEASREAVGRLARRP